MVSGGLDVIAAAIVREGQAERAARLLGTARALRSAVNVPLELADPPEYDRTVAAAGEALGEAAFSALHAEGEAMWLDQAIELALPERAAQSPAHMGPASHTP